MHQDVGVLVNGAYVSAVDVRYRPEKYQTALQAARDVGKVHCMCTQQNLRLVVKSRAGKLHLASWPDQSHLHSQLCPFYTPEVASSKDPASTTLPNTPEQKYRRADAQVPVDELASDVRLWGVIHELWDRSLMNRWVPGWHRDWTLARRHLIRAAKDVVLNGEALSAKLYLPQAFTPARRDEINMEWRAFSKPLIDRPRGAQESDSGFVLGVVAEVAKDARGYWLRLQHHREPFFISAQMWVNLSKLSRRGWTEISNGTVPKGRVVTLLRIEAMANLHFAAADCVLMRVTEKYIPANLDYEDLLVTTLLEAKRSFYRPLSFEQSHGSLPNLVLTDTEVKDCDLYVTGAGFPQHRLPAYTKERQQDSIARSRTSWHWSKSASRPALPAQQASTKTGG